MKGALSIFVYCVDSRYSSCKG